MDDVEEAAILEQMELDELMELRQDDGGARTGSRAVPEHEAYEYDDCVPMTSSWTFISSHPEAEQQAYFLDMDLMNS